MSHHVALVPSIAFSSIMKVLHGVASLRDVCSLNSDLPLARESADNLRGTNVVQKQAKKRNSTIGIDEFGNK